MVCKGSSPNFHKFGPEFIRKHGPFTALGAVAVSAAQVHFVANHHRDNARLCICLYGIHPVSHARETTVIGDVIENENPVTVAKILLRQGSKPLLKMQHFIMHQIIENTIHQNSSTVAVVSTTFHGLAA